MEQTTKPKASNNTKELLQRNKQKLINRFKILFKSTWLFFKSLTLIFYYICIVIVFIIIYNIEKKAENKKVKK